MAKKDRMVPVRRVGGKKMLYNIMVMKSKLKKYAETFSDQEFEWFDQPARKWRPIN